MNAHILFNDKKRNYHLNIELLYCQKDVRRYLSWLNYMGGSIRSEFIAPSISVTPRDEEAAIGQEDYYKVSAPVPGYKEKVYYHELASLPDGSTKVGLINRNFNNKQGLGIYITYSKKELPNLVQWKMVGQGHYVMGIEPANSWVSGRDLARKDGTLKYLEPGEKRSYKLEIGVLESQEEIEKLTREIKAIKE